MSIDTSSPTWRAITERASERIEAIRDALERDADTITTTRLRAELRVLRDVLQWPHDGRNEPPEGIELL